MYNVQVLFPTDSPPVSPPPTGQRSAAACSNSCISTIPKQHMADSTEMEEMVEGAEMGHATSRRIRAPQGEGLSSLMAALTSSKAVTSISEVHSRPHMATNSSLNSSSCNSVSYRSLNGSLSCCQVGIREHRPKAVAFTKTKTFLLLIHFCFSLLVC